MEQGTWLGLTLLLAVLAVNKQLELQTLLTDLGRAAAKDEGWYARRRVVQELFVALLCCGATLIIAALLWKVRRMRWSVKGAVVGTAVLFLFVFIRASSFHKVDIVINKTLGGVRVNDFMELGGISIVAICALAAIQMNDISCRRR